MNGASRLQLRSTPQGPTVCESILLTLLAYLGIPRCRRIYCKSANQGYRRCQSADLHAGYNSTIKHTDSPSVRRLRLRYQTHLGAPDLAEWLPASQRLGETPLVSRVLNLADVL